MWRLRHDTANTEIFVEFGPIATALAISLYIFERWAWRFPLFYGWLVTTPNLNGTWEGQTEPATITYLEHVPDLEQNSGATTRTMEVKISFDKLKEVTIEQRFSSLALTIDWDNGGKTQFPKASKFHVSGTRTKRIIFDTIYSYERTGTEWTRDAVMICSISGGRLFKNRPEKFTITYFTIDGLQRGKIPVTRRGSGTRTNLS